MIDARHPRHTAADFAPEVLRLFDQYVHGQLDRRGFLDRCAGHAAAAGTTATALLAALAPDFARAQQVAPADPRIQATTLGIDSPAGNGRVGAYVARPARASGPLPTVLVVHENRGLNPHIEDVARRFALEGYLAIAPDALTPKGGYPGSEDAARALFAQLDGAKAREDFAAAARWALKAPGGSGRVGVVGFCWGGGMSNWLATQVPELAAAAPFYGPGVAPEAAARIRAELLLVFAEHDERINAGWPAWEKALKAAGVRHEARIYPGTQHGFHNDSTPRFDAAAAADAWQRTLALFARTLRG